MYGRYSELAQFAKEFKAIQQRKNLLARNRKEGLLIGEGGKKKKSLKKRMSIYNIHNEYNSALRKCTVFRQWVLERTILTRTFKLCFCVCFVFAYR